MKSIIYLFKLCFYSYLLFGTTAYSQDPVQYGTPFAGVPGRADINLYQAHIRPYSASGNLAGVTARLDAIKALGINVIYVMPIYPYGTDSRSTNSPYCIKDFKAVGSEYGTLTDMRNLVDGAHSRGMAVILDAAINGTSWDHPWIIQHPDWYVQSGGVIQQLSSYPDVAALNFSNTTMRAALVDALRYWIFAANIDGYRCDFANNPPLDFWTNTINNLRSITTHKLIMFAEGDRQTNFQTGFDMNFGDQFYWVALTNIKNGGSVTTNLTTTTNYEYQYATSDQQVVRYTGNHDTEGSISPMSMFTNHAGVVANFVVAAYMRGVPMLTSGQEVDFNQTIPWPYTGVKINWNTNPSAAADFTKVLNFRTASTAIRQGTMTNYSDANVCAFTKVSGTEKVIVMVNLRNGTNNYVIPATLAGSYIDAYSGAAVTLTSGATRSLTAYQYVVLKSGGGTVTVTGVSISPTSVSIATGATSQLTATIAPSNATNQNVTWNSSNTAVATVSSTGMVTGVAVGTATITVKTADGAKTATCAITVQAGAQFTVYFLKPATWGTAIKVYWWSALPVGVLADGTWPGVGMTSIGNNWYSYTFSNVTSTNIIFNDGTNQTANLTASTNSWFADNTCYTSYNAVTGVTLSPTTATIAATATQQLTTTIAPSAATIKTLTWTSSNTAVAIVSSIGLVTGLAAGTTTITATTEDMSKIATCAVTVTAGAVTYYQIVNRWQTTTYLKDAGAGQVAYGISPASTDYTYQWQQVSVGDGSGYVYLKNRSTGNYMHIENLNGSVQCGAITLGWYSAEWSLVTASSPWVYLENRWQTSDWIHIENLLGYAQYGSASGWYSAEWQFVNGTIKSSEIELVSGNTSKAGVNVLVYPNPVENGYLTINFKTGDSVGIIRLFDLQGRNVFESTLSGSHTMLDVSSLVKGMYILNLSTTSGSFTQKILIQ